MYLMENDVDILHEEIKDLVGHLVENNVDTLHEERIHLVEFSFIRVIYERASSRTEALTSVATLWSDINWAIGDPNHDDKYAVKSLMADKRKIRKQELALLHLIFCEYSNI